MSPLIQSATTPAAGRRRMNATASHETRAPVTASAPSRAQTSTRGTPLRGARGASGRRQPAPGSHRPGNRGPRGRRSRRARSASRAARVVDGAQQRELSALLEGVACQHGREAHDAEQQAERAEGLEVAMYVFSTRWKSRDAPRPGRRPSRVRETILEARAHRGLPLRWDAEKEERRASALGESRLEVTLGGDHSDCSSPAARAPTNARGHRCRRGARLPELAMQCVRERTASATTGRRRPRPGRARAGATDSPAPRPSPRATTETRTGARGGSRRRAEQGGLAWPVEVEAARIVAPPRAEASDRHAVKEGRLEASASCPSGSRGRGRAARPTTRGGDSPRSAQQDVEVARALVAKGADRHDHERGRRHERHADDAAAGPEREAAQAQAGHAAHGESLDGPASRDLTHEARARPPAAARRRRRSRRVRDAAQARVATSARAAAARHSGRMNRRCARALATARGPQRAASAGIAPPAPAASTRPRSAAAPAAPIAPSTGDHGWTYSTRSRVPRASVHVVRSAHSTSRRVADSRERTEQPAEAGEHPPSARNCRLSRAAENPIASKPHLAQPLFEPEGRRGPPAAGPRRPGRS